MGYNVHAYAVDLAALRAAIGSNDGALVDAICKEQRSDLDAIDDVDAGEMSAVEAVARLIGGRVADGDVNFKYGYAVELVCRTLGTWLANRQWSAMRSQWFGAVDDAFGKLGGTSKLSREVFESGSPVAIPRIDDFPMIGTVSAERVGPLAREIEAALAGAPPSHEAESLRELLGWLTAAERSGRGLVTFYY